MQLNFQSYKTKGLLQGDAPIWTVLILLCIISVVEVYSASSGMSYSSGKYWQPVMEHGLFVFAGFVLAWLLHQVPCKLFKLFSLLLVVLSFGLLIWALVSGTKLNDTGRWIKILGKTIQPSEFAKLALVGYVAYIMSVCRDENNKISKFGLKMIFAVAIPFGILIGMENFSTAALLGLVVFVMLIIGEAPKKFMLTLTLVGGLSAGAVGTTLYTMSPDTAKTLAENVESLHRIETWVSRLHQDNTRPANPDSLDLSKNQQVNHANIAVATCNYVGKGPGKSVERDYLPQAFSDFIYAIIIEEGGIEIAVIVMFLYLLLLYRSWKIASRCAKPFPAYLAMGLSFMLVLQAIVNMGVAVGLLPVTGQPLPLVSKGGTSYLITCMYIGMIISVSRSARMIDAQTPALALAGSTETAEISEEESE